MRRIAALLLILVAVCASLFAQTPPKQTVLIKAGRLIDVRNGRVLNDQAILIEGDRIKEVGPSNQLGSKAAGARVIDLSGATVLPGMIDCHTHILLQGDITNEDYDVQLLKESIPFRTIRATVAARTGLMNGFTAMRDLETEGAMYADVDVKRAINAGYIDGPRMFVSTRAFSATGMYPLSGYSWELRMPEGVQIVDGADNIRRDRCEADITEVAVAGSARGTLRVDGTPSTAAPSSSTRTIDVRWLTMPSALASAVTARFNASPSNVAAYQ